MLWVANPDPSTWNRKSKGAVLSLFRSIKRDMWEELCRRVDPATLPAPPQRRYPWRRPAPQRAPRLPSLRSIADALGVPEAAVFDTLKRSRHRPNQVRHRRIVEALQRAGYQPAQERPQRARNARPQRAPSALVTVARAAKILRVPSSAVLAALASGRFPGAFRVGRSWRSWVIPQSDLSC